MIDTSSYTIIAHLFPRLLGAIYFFAFGAFLFQMKGLFGKNGILPIESYLDWLKRVRPKRCYQLAPTLFWLSAKDEMQFLVVALGTVCSALLVGGFYPTLLLICVFALYLSIISAGQDFLSFGWEVFLQEITLNAILLSMSPVPNLLVWISINLLLFRFHVQAGAVKIQSGDPNWKNLTAIKYHYQSQPIPNTLAWYVHKLPMWFHKMSCAVMFLAELVIPFLLFFTQEARLFVFVVLVGLQLSIWLTGNFSYLNHLTVVLCTILLNNDSLGILGFEVPAEVHTSLALDTGLSLMGGARIMLQLMRLSDHFFPNALFRKVFSFLAPWHIANRYGIFAVMTTTRYEVVIEASNDEKEWKEYSFCHKPSELARRPRRISPYQPRLDWQAWFLPFGRFDEEQWFHSFLAHLLRGTPEVLALIRHNPFPDGPPKCIRVMMYVYEFTSFKEKRETGNWWKRRFVGQFSPALKIVN